MSKPLRALYLATARKKLFRRAVEGGRVGHVVNLKKEKEKMSTIGGVREKGEWRIIIRSFSN